MPLWGQNDVNSNSTLFAAGQLKQAPNTTNRDALFENTTPDAYFTGQTDGQYAVSANSLLEVVYNLATATANAAGSGYVPGDVLTIANTGDANTVVDATVNVSATELLTVALNGVGTGGSYTPGALLKINTGTFGVNATANVTATKVRTVAVVAGGTGYANGDTVKLATGTQSTNAVFTVTTGVADTIVASLALTTNGVFTVNPTLVAGATANLTGSGTGLTVTVSMRIATIALRDRGSFTVNPTASGGATADLGAGAGTGATVDTTVRIKTLVVTADGRYLTLPEANASVLTGGTGTGATGLLTFNAEGAGNAGIAHPGWQLRREGSGNRAGRVHYETLVALKAVVGTSDILPED